MGGEARASAHLGLRSLSTSTARMPSRKSLSGCGLCTAPGMEAFLSWSGQPRHPGVFCVVDESPSCSSNLSRTAKQYSRHLEL